MNTRTYGHTTLAYLLFVMLWPFAFAAKEPTIILPTVLIIFSFSLLVPVVHINAGGVRVLSVNPFANNFRVLFTDVERIHIHAGYISCRISFYMKDGSVQSSTNFLRYDDIEKIFAHLCESGIDTSSTGIRAVTWKR